MQSSVDARYAQTLQYIHSLERFGVKPGLSRIRALCRALGDPQKHLRFIHVAGTNGKGSTSTMLAGICKEAGYKTGLYVSPFVLDFRERMQIDGRMIPKERQSCVRWQRYAEKFLSIRQRLSAKQYSPSGSLSL